MSEPTTKTEWVAAYWCEEHDEYEESGPYPSWEAANDDYHEINRSCSPRAMDIYERPVAR